MTGRITVYRDGRFTTEDAPAWWCEELNRVVMYDVRLGDEAGSSFMASRVDDQRGFVVNMAVTEDLGIDVWAPTPADFLALLTERVPAFNSLTQGRPIAETLAALTNAVIAFGRHGPGVHIGREDGLSEKDARADVLAAREAEVAQSRKGVSSPHPPASGRTA